MENKDKNKNKIKTHLLFISILIILLSLGAILLIRRYYKIGYKSTNTNTNMLPRLTLDLYNIDAFMQYDY
jgi:hypothetical protein